MRNKTTKKLRTMGRSELLVLRIIMGRFRNNANANNSVQETTHPARFSGTSVTLPLYIFIGDSELTYNRIFSNAAAKSTNFKNVSVIFKKNNVFSEKHDFAEKVGETPKSQMCTGTLLDNSIVPKTIDIAKACPGGWGWATSRLTLGFDSDDYNRD